MSSLQETIFSEFHPEIAENNSRKQNSVADRLEAYLCHSDHDFDINYREKEIYFYTQKLEIFEENKCFDIGNRLRSVLSSSCGGTFGI